MGTMTATIAAVAMALLCAAPAGADIYVWHDAQGVRHYTNSRELVPEAQRQDATVLVAEPARAASTAGSEPATQPPQRAAPEERQAEVVRYAPSVEDAYAAGLRQGMAEAQQAPAVVQFNAPLVAAVSSAPPPPPYPSYCYYGRCYRQPLVTTSFDRGRSRHQTLRMLLQDQFAIDREGPYVYAPRFFPPGPALNLFLPRGLPNMPPPPIRVITH